MPNEYADWTGAAPVNGSRIFTSEGHHELNLDDYPSIKAYMPRGLRNSETTTAHYLIARVATTSKKTLPAGDIVKLFANGSWNEGLRRALENMEFTKLNGNLDQLISDVPLFLDAGEWQVSSPIIVYRDRDPPGRPTAKVVFVNAKDNSSIDAFWCWPS